MGSNTIEPRIKPIFPTNTTTIKTSQVLTVSDRVQQSFSKLRKPFKSQSLVRSIAPTPTSGLDVCQLSRTIGPKFAGSTLANPLAFGQSTSGKA